MSITPEQVREARKRLGLTQTELAKLSSVSQWFISRYETTGTSASVRPRARDYLGAIRAALEAAGLNFDEPSRVQKPPSLEPITPEQARQARLLLELSQQSLAISARIPQEYIGMFERTGRLPTPHSGGPNYLSAIRLALEEAGAEFTINESEPGVRLRKAEDDR